jgi:hypothetical protein
VFVYLLATKRHRILHLSRVLFPSTVHGLQPYYCDFAFVSERKIDCRLPAIAIFQLNFWLLGAFGHSRKYAIEVRQNAASIFTNELLYRSKVR